MREIPLNHGKTALVDDEDYDPVAGHTWSAVNTARPGKPPQWYAMRYEGGRTIYLHRVVMGDPPGIQIDHQNRRTLDCRKQNLRQATPAQQSHNRTKRSGTKHRFKGVRSARRRWRAVIYVQGKAIPLGGFATEEEAARAYDAKARELFGPFACVNFPET